VALLRSQALSTILSGTSPISAKCAAVRLPSSNIGRVNKVIPLAVARDELTRIDTVLDSPQLLIGGLAIQQYYQNRDSADIDLVCSAATAKKLIDDLYHPADFDIVDKSDDPYRPSWIITETGEGKRVVYLGFKITERAAYNFVEYDRILRQATPYRYKDELLKHIKVPTVEDLAFLKLLSLVSRLSSNPPKGEQDLRDFITLISHREFKARVFLDPITSECRDYLINEIAKLQETRDKPLFANSSPARLFDILFPPKPIDMPSAEPDTVQAPVGKVSEKPSAARAPVEKVSKEHGIQLREAAKRWANVFSSLLTPDWAVHVVKMESFDSDEGLSVLRAHFPELNNAYSTWRPKNTTLGGVETMPYWLANGTGDLPTTDQGKAALREHNELVQAIVTELAKIEVQTGYTGQCDQCEGSESP
jgi:hypothetical protein